MSVNDLSHDPGERVVAVERLDALTSLRFFAASLIVLKHLSSFFQTDGTSWIDHLALHQGVAFFFVLSGFILTYVHPTLSGWQSCIKFLRARFARIYPTYLLGLVSVCCITQAFNYQKHFPQILCANLFLLQDWIPQREFFYSLNAPAWSISCELFFYLCFLFLIQNLSKYWAAILVGSLVTAMACLVVDATVLMNPLLHISEDTHRWFTMPSPLLRLFEFCLGMCSANFFNKLKAKGSKPEFVNTRLEIALTVLCLALVFLPLAFSRLPENQFDWRIGEYVCSSGGAPVYAALLFIFAFQAGKLSKFLTKPFFVMLGELSFALYILHCPVIFYLTQHRADFVHLDPNFLFVAVWLTLLAISHFSFKFLEKPLRTVLTANL